MFYDNGLCLFMFPWRVLHELPLTNVDDREKKDDPTLSYLSDFLWQVEWNSTRVMKLDVFSWWLFLSAL